MTTVTVLAGERTIGGTQIVVEDGGARLLFDCGLAFSPATDPFAYVAHRPATRLADLIRLGLAPHVPGLYLPSLVAGLAADLPPSDRPLAVALSHSHLDHTHLAGLVDPSVPVYASPATARIVRMLGEVGASTAPMNRPMTEVRPGASFEVGPMRVRLLPVDHDVCGASGLLVETSNGVIAYPGDFRLHGRHPEASLAFARAAREARARVIILEGTRLFPPPENGAPPIVERVEDDVPITVAEAIRAHHDRLGLILLTPENGERVEAIAGAVADMGRLFVLDVEGLAFATAALGRPLAMPHGVYVPSTLQGNLTPTLRAAIEAAPTVVRAEDLVAGPHRFLLRLSFHHFADLLEILPSRQGGVLITSNGVPLGPFDPAYAHMEWWAETFGFELVDAGSTGHAAPRDLALMASQSGAPRVMAIHSRFPELMPVPPDRLLLPQRGYRYEL